MINRSAFTSALVTTLFLSAAPVLAAPQERPSAAADQEITSTSAPDLRAFAKAKVSIASAIAIAIKHVNGSKVIDVSFNGSNGKPVYKVKTYQNSSVWEGLIDAQSGQVIGEGKSTQESQLDEEDKAELAGLQQAATTLEQAVNTAERRVAGKAISAGLEETKGKVVFEIMIVKSGSVQKIVIDPKTGHVVS
jgi:uncharacterized membrane protein YkoI